MPVDPILDIAAIERFGIDTGVFALMNSKWGWPVCEIIHFFGLCLLIGSVGMFDLRMMGVARGVPIASLHRLVPFGVAGWLLCAATGVLFILAAPSQYLYNPAFQTKMSLMALAGVNMAVFYAVAARAAKAVGPDELPPVNARVIALVSLACWLGVIACGRVITFFRPPYIWCLWCGS
jgi:hypothetical protein